MSLAFSIQTTSTVWPLMSIPRIASAWVRTSAASAASLMPPALPAAAHLHLGLHHDRVAERVGVLDRLRARWSTGAPGDTGIP